MKNVILLFCLPVLFACSSGPKYKSPQEGSKLSFEIGADPNAMANDEVNIGFFEELPGCKRRMLGEVFMNGEEAKDVNLVPGKIYYVEVVRTRGAIVEYRSASTETFGVAIRAEANKEYKLINRAGSNSRSESLFQRAQGIETWSPFASYEVGPCSRYEMMTSEH